MNVDEIVEPILEFRPLKIVLFGSHAHSRATKNSDIDLYVVVDQPEPKNYEEYLQLRLKIAKKISPLQKKYPIDLIVHTPKMHQRFFKEHGSFAQEIEKGKLVWQKD